MHNENREPISVYTSACSGEGATDRPYNEPAFPIHGGLHEHQFCGMDLRDYFAIHGEEPSQAELLASAGLVQGADGIYAEADSANVVFKSFYDWFHRLPVDARFAMCAKVRYLMADAMLAARTQQ
jgi:hypothetical protein